MWRCFIVLFRFNSVPWRFVTFVCWLITGRSTLASGQKENDLSWAPKHKPPGNSSVEPAIIVVRSCGLDPLHSIFWTQKLLPSIIYYIVIYYIGPIFCRRIWRHLTVTLDLLLTSQNLGPYSQNLLGRSLENFLCWERMRIFETSLVNILGRSS